MSACFSAVVPVLFPALFLSVFSCAKDRVSDRIIVSYAKAKAVYAEGNFSEAANMLEALDSFPPALILRAKALYFSDHIAGAEKTLRRLLYLRPSSLEGVLYLSRILMEKGDLKEANRMIESLLSDDPENIRALRFAAELAFLKGSEGDAEGIAYLNRAVEAATEVSMVLLDRARFRWVGGDARGALGDLALARTIITEKNPLSRSIESLEKTIQRVLP